SVRASARTWQASGVAFTANRITRSRRVLSLGFRATEGPCAETIVTAVRQSRVRIAKPLGVRRVNIVLRKVETTLAGGGPHKVNPTVGVVVKPKVMADFMRERDWLTGASGVLKQAGAGGARSGDADARKRVQIAGASRLLEIPNKEDI